MKFFGYVDYLFAAYTCSLFIIGMFLWMHFVLIALTVYD